MTKFLKLSMPIIGLVFSASLSFAMTCKDLVMGHEKLGPANLCSKTAGCTVNWKKYADQEPKKVAITDQLNQNQTSSHLVFSPAGFTKATASFDSADVLGSSLQRLRQRAMANQKAYGQLFLVRPSQDGSVVIESSRPFSSQYKVVVDALEIHRQYESLLVEVGSRDGLNQFPVYTIIYLSADPYTGVPFVSDQRVPLDQVAKFLAKEQGIPENQPNKFWAVKMTQNFQDNEPTIFLYDPAVDKP